MSDLVKPPSQVIVEPESNPAAVYVASLAAGSRPAALRCVDVLSSFLGVEDRTQVDWTQVRHEHTSAIRAKLIDTGYAPATCNLTLSVLRGILRQAWMLGQVDAEQYQRAAAVKSVRGKRPPAGRDVSRGELFAVIKACDPTKPSGARDGAIIGLGYATGCRRSELVTIQLEDLSWADDVLEIKVRGKGDKVRRLYVSDEGAHTLLKRWLRHRGDEPGPLFRRVLGKTVQAGGISKQTVRDVCLRACERAGVRPFSPHDLRRTLIGDLWDARVDAPSVKALAGHSNIETTIGYDRRGERAKRKAASEISVPVEPHEVDDE